MAVHNYVRACVSVSVIMCACVFGRGLAGGRGEVSGGGEGWGGGRGGGGEQVRAFLRVRVGEVWLWECVCVRMRASASAYKINIESIFFFIAQFINDNRKGRQTNQVISMTTDVTSYGHTFISLLDQHVAFDVIGLNHLIGQLEISRVTGKCWKMIMIMTDDSTENKDDNEDGSDRRD